MHPDKFPGLDGMTLAFYQKHWSIVGADVVQFVREFFDSGKFPDSINDTHIVLIPKKKNPTQVSDMRPISLCNVLYKIASKVVANRMKGVLSEAISETQSAFVSGRLISDNVMVAFEAMHYLKRKTNGRKGYMAIKLDMSKAYDRVEWGFLESILRVMGFSVRWIGGIRQGCPLSPYLFIVCAKGLSSLIRHYETTRLITGCKDAAIILGIPLHQAIVNDSWYWIAEKNGFYSVRSAYNSLQQLKHHSDSSEAFSFWKILWSLKVPPKAKDLVWRATSNCLASKRNLCIKRYLADSSCPFVVFSLKRMACIVSCHFAWSCFVCRIGQPLEGIYFLPLLVVGSYYAKELTRVEASSDALLGHLGSENDLERVIFPRCLLSKMESRFSDGLNRPRASNSTPTPPSSIHSTSNVLHVIRDHTGGLVSVLAGVFSGSVGSESARLWAFEALSQLKDPPFSVAIEPIALFVIAT
uniref:Reverse transcriptase domain-containing protein n=1 Tax=Cannabis sativa TaxID=3483 RepID=A0A803NNP5_CANSA